MLCQWTLHMLIVKSKSISTQRFCPDTNTQYTPLCITYVYFKKSGVYNIQYSLHSRQGTRHGTQGLHVDSRPQCSHILQLSDWTGSEYQCCLWNRKLGHFVLLTRQGSYWIRLPINVLKNKIKINHLQCKIAPCSPESCPWQTTRSGVHDSWLWRSLYRWHQH